MLIRFIRHTEYMLCHKSFLRIERRDKSSSVDGRNYVSLLDLKARFLSMTILKRFNEKAGGGLDKIKQRVSVAVL